MNQTLFRKSDRTRKYIIEKTAPVFNKKGYAGTSLSELVAATGLTKGSIYGNFKSKDELAMQAFEYNVNNLFYFLETEINKQESTIRKLLAVPNAYRKLFNRMLNYGGCPILNTATEADDTHKELSRLAIQAVEKFKQYLIDLVHQGIALQEIDREVDAQNFAQTTLAIIEGGTMLSKLTGEKSYLLNSLNQIEDKVRQMASSK